jgi:hypothetical protein
MLVFKQVITFFKALHSIVELDFEKAEIEFFDFETSPKASSTK